MAEEKEKRPVRHSKHSIDRFLLVAVLGYFYRDYYLYLGSEKAFKHWKSSWSKQQQMMWSKRKVIQEMRLAQAMNVWLKEQDAVLLRQSLTQGGEADDEYGEEDEIRSEEEWYRKLKQLMMLQYTGEEELQTLRAQKAASVRYVVPRKSVDGKKRKYVKEVGIQRKTVKKLLEELVTLERRLQAMEDQELADWLAARVQGFRLVRCDAKERIYHIAAVVHPEQQMAAVQAAYYPFLDKKHTDQILNLLWLTSEHRDMMDSVSEEKDKRPGSELPEQLDRALTAVETVWNAYGETEKAASGGDNSQELFWYELDYYRWQEKAGRLELCKIRRIPLLPWRVVYSNGYFYLCGFRLDLDKKITGGESNQKLVFSNLRLDRVRDLRQVRLSETECDVDYTVTEIEDILVRMYESRPRAALQYRDDSTIMYSGTPETLLIDCEAALLNSAVDDFGRDNIRVEEELTADRVRIRVKKAVWEGAKQWLLQHAGACCLTDCEAQAEKRRQMADLLRGAAGAYES